MLSDRLGHTIRYPSDCNLLSTAIYDSVRKHIGVTTLKRMYGFVGGVARPRESTLDIIALFLGFTSYVDLIDAIDPDAGSDGAVTILSAGDLDAGRRLFIGLPEGTVSLTALGDASFRVDASACTVLISDYIVSVESFRVGYPLYVRELVRNDTRQGRITLAALSGIKSISLTTSSDA